MKLHPALVIAVVLGDQLERQRRQSNYYAVASLDALFVPPPRLADLEE